MTPVTFALLGVPDVWLYALGSAVAGILLGYTVHLVVKGVLVPLADKTTTPLDNVLVATLRAPVVWTFIFVGFFTGARILLPDDAYAITFSRTLTTGILVIWGAAVSHLLTLTMRNAFTRFPNDRGHAPSPVLERLVKIAIGIVIVLTIFTVWDFEITPLLASAGIVGIALALAAQDTLSNFFAGIAIYLDRPYQVGDLIVLDPSSASEMRGEVRDIGLRSTRLRTRDDVLVTVPNSIIANARVLNESGDIPQYRIRISVGVAYDSDLARVERVLEGIANDHPLVIRQPEARARVRGFADSSVNWDLLVWIRDPRDRGLVIHELSKTIHRTFQTEGIRIPFPQRDVHIDHAGPRAIAVAGASLSENASED